MRFKKIVEEGRGENGEGRERKGEWDTGRKLQGEEEGEKLSKKKK